MTSSKLSCHNLWKIYGQGFERRQQATEAEPDADALREQGMVVAVQDASIDVAEGEIFVIMGLSGSGKSTLLRCLSRLIESTRGDVIFDGHDLNAISETELIDIRRHKMGMVFQHFALLPHLTVLQNVAFPLDVQGIDRREREERAMEMIELVGLTGREAYFPGELSGGQQQRVGIARSLAVKPDVWFLDEPFSALDPLIRREMQDEFLRLQNLLKKTIIFITHDIDEAIRVADRIAIMKDGKIVQTGTAAEIVLTPSTSYVAEFTRDVPRAKVLTAASLMEPLSDTADLTGPTVTARTSVRELTSLLAQPSSEAIVVDDQNHPIGRVRRETIIEVLMDVSPKQVHQPSNNSESAQAG